MSLHLHAITAERRLVHPAVVVLIEQAQRHPRCTTVSEMLHNIALHAVSTRVPLVSANEAL